MSDVLPEDTHRATFSKLDDNPMVDGKQFRYDLKALITRVEHSTSWTSETPNHNNHPSTARFEAIRKLKEAFFWLGEDLDNMTSKRSEENGSR